MMKIKKIKIGVISDTHLDDYDPKMQKRIAGYFDDADLILHAGDMVDLNVLKMFGIRTSKPFAATWITIPSGKHIRIICFLK